MSTKAHPLLTLFLSERKARGLSPETLKFYHTYLRPFLNGDPLTVTKADMVAFLDSLTCSPGGKHAYFRAIRAFYGWLVEQDYLPSSPVERLKAPKVPRPLRPSVPLADISTLLQGCDGVRDRAIVAMLADTGLRRAELASINVEDIRGDTVTVWGKGAKERVVRFGPVTHTFLQEWLQGRKTGSLFGLNKWGIGEMLERLEKRTGIRCNAHAFRRTFATESIRNGSNLFHVQSLLGHEDLTMTRIYAHQVNSEDAIRHYKPIVR